MNRDISKQNEMELKNSVTLVPAVSPSPLNSTRTMLYAQRFCEFHTNYTGGAGLTHLRKGKVLQFGPESAKFKLNYLVSTAIICLCDDDLCKKWSCVGRVAALEMSL